MHINNLHLNILHSGRVMEEFVSPMDFQTYIEGRDSSEFEVQIVNHNTFDVEAIVSIDGLSIIDGKPAGNASAGYLVRARETMTIPGWKVDGSTAAKFQFSGSKGGSYVDKIGGDSLNKGVIGLKAFASKVSRVYTVNNMAFSKGMGVGGMRSMGMGVMGGPATSSFGGAASIQCSSSNAVNTSITSGSLEGNLLGSATVEQTLGTDFGAATEFKTQEVQFERGDLQSMMELYYDDRQGLKRRGIDVTKPASRPSAFPADTTGCAAPAGWNR